jgi:alkanesulfonate monooxygenase SsuD/methylene tetrahydromethanopterin reductase-like flavin-dependent oxidoreductase (luciferase family)
MLSRTQPRPPDAPNASLADIQNPMIDAYLEALPGGREPRILASRSVFVADDRKEAMRLAEIGLVRLRHRLAATGNLSSGSLVGDLITAFDAHVGTPEDVIASLQADATLERATDHVPGPFDRPAAILHPAFDRAGR